MNERFAEVELPRSQVRASTVKDRRSSEWLAQASGHDPTHDALIASLSALWLRRFWILTGAILSAAGACVFFAMSPAHYESTAVVMHLEAPPLRPPETKALWEPPSHMSRLTHLSTSSEVLHGLINRHSLYRHYSIDTTETGYFERAMAQLHGNIRLMLLDESTMSITVRDTDRQMAQALAASLVEQLQSITKRLSSHRLSTQILLARRMIEHQEGLIASHMARVRELQTNLESLDVRAERVGAKRLLELHEQFAQIGAGLTLSYSELSGFAKQVEVMESMDRADPTGSLLVVNRPLLDVHRSSRANAAWGIAISAVIGALCCIIAIVLWALMGAETKHIIALVRQSA